MLENITLYFVDEHRPNNISYTIIEVTQQGNKILAHGASVRMLEIVAAAYPGQCKEMPQNEFRWMMSRNLLQRKKI